MLIFPTCNMNNSEKKNNQIKYFKRFHITARSSKDIIILRSL